MIQEINLGTQSTIIPVAVGIIHAPKKNNAQRRKMKNQGLYTYLLLEIWLT
jgi:hypothetical protein